jgi:hypothetical protein
MSTTNHTESAPGLNTDFSIEIEAFNDTSYGMALSIVNEATKKHLGIIFIIIRQ